MKRIILQFMAVTALVAFVESCDKEKSGGSKLPESVVSVKADSWDIDYTAQELTVRFEVEKPREGVEVSFTTTADWVKIGTPGTYEVKIDVEENIFRTETRSAKIFVGYDDLDPQIFTLTQDYLHAQIVLSRQSESADCQAQEVPIAVEIQNPIEWEILSVETSAEWLSAEPKDYGIKVNVHENTTGELRSAIVTISYPGAEPASLIFEQKAVKEYETITGIKWALYNCGTDEEHPYGVLYNWTERATACGDGWRPANYKEMDILFSSASEFVSYNGVYGRWYSGKTDYAEGVPSIFLAAAGACWAGDTRGQGEFGYFWTDDAWNNGASMAGRRFTTTDEGFYSQSSLSVKDNYKFSLRCVRY